ncbi:MAG: mechanosensitive ion channel [Candidatus Omnitrophica bacterium]|nr:mechanosensitive ion channel [Candidatus Omnitrophota bacterium]
MRITSKVHRILNAVFVFTALPCVVHAQNQIQENQPPKSVEELAAQQVDTIRHLLDMVVEFFVKYSFQVLGGIIVLVVGWYVAQYVGKILFKFLGKYKLDVTVSKFLVGGVKLAIVVFTFIVALGKFGVEIAPLIAGISVVGFGTSFALQGPLSNIAAGIMLIFTKPFKVGDIIEVQDVSGQVLDIKLPRTEIRNVDGHMIVIPNNKIIGEVIHNYSILKRIDVLVGVSYSGDVTKAMEIMENIIKNDSRITPHAETKVGLAEFGDSSINLQARIWVKQKDFWSVKFETNKKIFDAFNEHGIVIPFPQRDVHIIQDNA